LPIRLGSVQISHLSDPAQATLNDSTFGKDAFSIQLNTNFFTANNGNTGWVQFVLQSRPKATDILCVWQVDVTVAFQTSNASGYSPTCVNVPKLRWVWEPNDPWPDGGKQTTFVGPGAAIAEKSEIAGYLDDTQQGRPVRLTAWAYVPWAPFQAYAVSVNDQYGLRGRWTDISGDILGLGNGSRADFTGTKIRTVLEATPCILGQCPNVQPQYRFSNNATQDFNFVTAETNNLFSFYDYAPHVPVFSCQQDTCTLEYSSGPRSIIKFFDQERLSP
jgi:hypothetical protein